MPPPPPGGAPGSPPDLPPGIYGELRNPQGKVVHKTRTFGQPKPELPAKIPVSSSPGSPAVFTVPGTGPSDFRAAAYSPGPGAGTVVAAVSLQDVNQTLSHLRLIGGIVTAAVLAALAALAWWVIRIGLRPLERMQETANAIAGGDMSARVETTDERTEVGRLGASLNSMLGQIERAFAEREASEERLRRFLADASHELRTPLTSIRGYAEAFRLGPARDPDELEKAMSRIEDEAARMGVLVDELLTLARLDEVRQRARRPVDLATVAAEACADARAANPGRIIELAAGSRAEVTGDQGQLHQVVANLLRNAVQHTPGGSPIDVSVSAGGRDVTLAVRDHGEGLPPGAAEHAFERFGATSACGAPTTVGRDSASRSSPRSPRRTAAAPSQAMRRAGVRSSRSCCPRGEPRSSTREEPLRRGPIRASPLSRQSTRTRGPVGVSDPASSEWLTGHIPAHHSLDGSRGGLPRIWGSIRLSESQTAADGRRRVGCPTCSLISKHFCFARKQKRRFHTKAEADRGPAPPTG